MKKRVTIVDKAVANLAYKAAKRSANSNCAWIFHQPKTPETLKKLRKF
ncbi:MAG: cyclic lactone autoinducer peptide [Lachnospiraceae bacterium]|nr:cyclic lactone autoinducer peptide [Lachnospiraceae bacterium]